MSKWLYPAVGVLPVGAFFAGLAIGGALHVDRANAEIPVAGLDPSVVCVLHNMEKIQHVHSHQTFSPLTWLIEECRKNPLLHG